MNVLKTLLMQKSKNFCLMPWIHIHGTPAGVAAPCCISESCATSTGVGNTREKNLMELVNSEKMNQLRLDMLTGVTNSECDRCHQHEKQGIKSFRQMSIDEFGHHFDEVIDNTNDDGSLKQFKMRYYDIRFSNICNFKCRTCGPEFSSQWEQENQKYNQKHYIPVLKNNNKKLLSDVIEQIDHLDAAYFAGGEPLITEEHYILLEEMIKRKRTNIRLRYNTNLSNLKFKNKDILALWKHFKHKIDIYASIDHYGERAEYIRHGTDWGLVESNFKLAQEQSFISLQMNTVLSVFNVLTIDQFYSYLVEKGLYSPESKIYTLYAMSTPFHLSAHILPPEYKELAKQSLENAVKVLKKNKFRQPHLEQVGDAISWVTSVDTWEEQKYQFRDEVSRLDRIRNERFAHVFPELEKLIKPERIKLWPI